MSSTRIFLADKRAVPDRAERIKFCCFSWMNYAPTTLPQVAHDFIEGNNEALHPERLSEWYAWEARARIESAEMQELVEALQRLSDWCDRLRLSGQVMSGAEKNAHELLEKLKGGKQ